MDFSDLSNSELESTLVSLTGSEREVTLKILYSLIELEKRGLYRELGYSSLFCTAHNRLLAEEHFGKEFIKAKIHAGGPAVRPYP